MEYATLAEVPTDLVVEDGDDWLYEHRHGTWGVRQPRLSGSRTAQGYWETIQDGYYPWSLIRPDEQYLYDEFGPFSYTEVAA